MGAGGRTNGWSSPRSRGPILVDAGPVPGTRACAAPGRVPSMAFGDGISLRLVGRMGAALFLAGGLGSAASLLLPAPETLQVGALALNSLAATLVGLVVWFLPWERWPRPASLVLVPIAFTLIAIQNHFSGGEPYRY